MKRLFTITLLALATATYADDFRLYHEENARITIDLGAIADMKKITFEKDRFIIEFKDGQTGGMAYGQRLYFATQSTVGIDEVNTAVPSKPESIYDLTGRKINASRVSELPKGTYIMDGKKVLVK